MIGDQLSPRMEAGSAESMVGLAIDRSERALQCADQTTASVWRHCIGQYLSLMYC